MAQTWDSKRLRHERDMDAQLVRELAGVGRSAGRVLLRYAIARNESGQRVIPVTRDAASTITAAIWREVLRPYFVGAGDDPLEGQTPQSPYTRLLVAGIEGAVRIQAERTAAIVARASASDPVVQRWLTGPRPAGLTSEMLGTVHNRNRYDPFHLWLDPNGRRLSDRVWQTGVEVRRRIDELLTYHIAEGTSAVEAAELLEEFLTPGAAAARTRTPYGSEGSYAARRLLRTEITAAAGRTVMAANIANPYVDGTDWRLSASHPRIDICDELATLGMSGERRRPPYEPGSEPQYPAHPHELCSLLPHVMATPAEVTQQIRAGIEQRDPETLRLAGAFDLTWMIPALVQGFWLPSVLGEEALQGMAVTRQVVREQAA